MPISFARPEALLFAIPVLALTFLATSAGRRRIEGRRRRAALAVRTLLLTFLTLALAGIQVALPVERLTTVFVVDVSDSVGGSGREEAVAFLREALAALPDGDQAGIVAFGSEAVVERLPTSSKELDRIASAPRADATDIGGALRLAGALFPDASQKRIVLLSDGNDTTGRGQAEAAVAGARGVQVETRLIGRAATDEVIVERLHTPATARVGEEIEAEVTVRSTVEQTASVRLYGDGAQVASRDVTLTAGTNRVVFTVRATKAGFHTFRAVVEAGRDTFEQNDRADSDTIVKGDPKILVVAADASLAANLVAALEAERQDVTLTAASAMPSDLRALAAFDSVVLVDVPAESLGDRRLSALQVYTRDLGRGLVMVGGKESYGAGGYRKTPLEEALPVDMDVRDREKKPDVALVVVLDRSGSMDACHCNPETDFGSPVEEGPVKVDIGKEAILRAVAALTERDQFGLVAFNHYAEWVIRTAPLGGVGDIESHIAGIRPDGETNIFAGLSEAVSSLENTAASRRHVILLTDGWSTSGDYEGLLRRMEGAGITLSTVGAGSGSAEILEDLARQGGGRYYPARDVETIPDIFLKETQQVSGEQIVEESFFPIQTSTSPILRGLETGLPRLLGYNGTTIKAAAQNVLVSTRDDPVLAQWQYGLGRSVAWTSDATGRWARDWVAWPGFNRFFSQLVAWTFPGEETGGIEARFLSEGERTRLRLESVESDGTPRDLYETQVTMVAPDLKTSTVRLQQTAPGVYEADLGAIGPGAYALRVRQTKPGATALGRTLGLVAPTPAEYRLLGTNERLLATLRGATGGREVREPRDVWRHDLTAARSVVDLWPLLLVLALLLWPLDVAIRRVSLTRSDVAAARAWLGARWSARGAPAERPPTLGGMLAAKERAAAGRARAVPRHERPPVPDAPETTPRVRQSAPDQPEERPPTVPRRGPAAVPDATTPEVPTPETLARLREAKRRARR